MGQKEELSYDTVSTKALADPWGALVLKWSQSRLHGGQKARLSYPTLTSHWVQAAPGKRADFKPANPQGG